MSTKVCAEYKGQPDPCLDNKLRKIAPWNATGSGYSLIGKVRNLNFLFKDHKKAERVATRFARFKKVKVSMEW